MSKSLRGMGLAYWPCSDRLKTLCRISFYVSSTTYPHSFTPLIGFEVSKGTMDFYRKIIPSSRNDDNWLV